MTKLAVFALVICLVPWCGAHPASAQTRTFVAALGSDSNPCTFAWPCRTFQHAHDIVAAGGEIDVLDPAGYGPVTISKAISIQGHGYAGVGSANGAVAITVAAGPGDKINLRGALLEGGGSGGTGILFNSGGSLDIQDSIIRNFTSGGIAFQPGAAAALSVSDTVVDDNAGTGILISPSAGNATAILDRVQANHDGAGITAGGAGTSNTMVRDSTIANNQTTGIAVTGAGAVVRVTRSTVSGNATGLSISGGTILSYGDNSIDGNTSNGSASNTLVLH